MSSFERFEKPGIAPRPDWWLVRPSEIVDFCKKTEQGRLYDRGGDSLGVSGITLRIQ